ncbi:MAG: putative signal transducing protein [Bacteroidota bacterium]
MEGWKVVFSTDKIYNAEMAKSILQENGVEAAILNHKDSEFLIGDIEVFVEEKNETNALNILKDFKS